MLLAAALAGGCKKKEEIVEEVPPPPNRASLDVVNTQIGTGLGLKAGLAPSSIQLERVVVLDEDRAVLLGHDNDSAWALRTSDRGRTWTSLNAPAKQWTSWGVAQDGSLTLTTGSRERPKAGPAKAPAGPANGAQKPEPIIDASVWFAGPDEKVINGPRTFFPDEGKLKGVTIAGGVAVPALIDGPTASLLVDRNKAPAVVYASANGTTVPEPVALDKGNFVPIPYGRPPRLLSVKGANLDLYNWPKPGDTLGLGATLPNYRADNATLNVLSQGPSCEAGTFAFRRIPGSQPWAIAISGDRAAAIKLPQSDAPRLGCATDSVVVETTTLDPTDAEKKRKVPQLVRCTLDGKCSEPKAPPFAIWSEKHDRDIWAVPTSKGLVAVMRAKSGSRWAIYLGQSNDGGNTYELPRTIGEGKDDRGYLDVGAIIRFPQRLVLLLTADVGATGRRGWYALASDDDGNNWGPP